MCESRTQTHTVSGWLPERRPAEPSSTPASCTLRAPSPLPGIEIGWFFFKNYDLLNYAGSKSKFGGVEIFSRPKGIYRSCYI